MRNFWQIINYSGVGLALLGSLLASIIPDTKIKIFLNISLGIVITIIAGIILLISAIRLDHFTSKLEDQKQQEFSHELTVNRQKFEEYYNKNLLTERFHAEVDNTVQSMYLIFDLGNTLLENSFSDFCCIMRFIDLDITIQFKSLNNDFPASENAQFLEARIVKGKNLKNSPFMSVSKGSFKNMSEFYLDLNFIKRYLPEKFTVRDLENQSIYLYMSENQTKLIKNVKLNVNDWDVFIRGENKIKWREVKHDWLPKDSGLLLLHQECQSKYFDRCTIKYFREGFNYYQILESKKDTDSRVSIEEINKLLFPTFHEEGSLQIEISREWRKKNNKLIEYIPLITKNGFSVRVFRDSDNILKVYLGYLYADNLILRCKNSENYEDGRNNNSILFTWGKKGARLYIEGNEVDEVKINY
jgi:hypothetical protein